MKILILGATGMIGHTLLRYFHTSTEHSVAGTVRDASALSLLSTRLSGAHVLSGVAFLPEDVAKLSSTPDFAQLASSGNLDDRCARVVRSLLAFQPDVVINAIGIIKHHGDGDDAVQLTAMNTVLPHVLSRLTQQVGARLIQLSTDCVFSGRRGNYSESDEADAAELYGRSKFLGEIQGQKHVLTLRTSFIGHELTGAKNLLEWFLSQKEQTQGYRQAIYSGLATVELARVIHEYVLPRPDLYGLYHVSAEPINKYNLIQAIADQYGKEIKIKAVDEPVIDRSLNSGKFRQTTHYVPKSWSEMLRDMHAFH